MTCIFKKSEYYAKAVLNPLDIVEPIGYKFLHESQEKKVAVKKNYGEIKNRFLLQKSLSRQISTIRTMTNEVLRSLKESESTRKNYYMSGTNLDTLSKDSTIDLINELKARFFKDSEKQDLINFLQLVFCMQSFDSFFSIRDYALSTYFVYYNGENSRFYKHLEEMLQVEFLEYEHEILINSPKLSRPQLRRVNNYENIREVEEYIREINQIGQEKDAFYNGVHIFICDLIPQSNSTSFAQEQKQFWPFLQFNILVILSILAQGQHAILRIRGTFTHKTSQYIYLLKMAFNRINFHKNIISNPFTHDKYMICETFNKENGKIIAEYLLSNYQFLFRYQDQKLLVDPKVTFANDFQKNIATYNDSTPIMKYSKQLASEFAQNSSINIYPNKQALLKRLEELKIKNISEIIEEMKEIVPDSTEKKEEQKSKEIYEKKAVVFDLSQLKFNEPITQKANIDYYDISQKKSKGNEDLYQAYMSRAEKSIKDKKEKSKKKKTQKQDDL